MKVKFTKKDMRLLNAALDRLYDDDDGISAWRRLDRLYERMVLVMFENVAQPEPLATLPLVSAREMVAKVFGEGNSE